jgi:formylglycine-generating enzyme
MRVLIAFCALFVHFCAFAKDGMALIPAGTFTMGRTRETPDDKTGMRPLVLRDDRPPHKVTLDEFWMDTHEVTQAQYAEFVKKTGHRTPYHWLNGKLPEGKEKHPVHNVDWNDATAYCKWAGKRLPTEAEWERAARGGLEGQDYPWGDKITPADARFNTAEGPGPVGSYKPNAFGLYDMAGSVSEWCNDWFERTYYESSPAKNPQGPETGQYKIIRGGSWADGPRRVTVFFRNWVRPNQTTPNLGFRCVQ